MSLPSPRRLLFAAAVVTALALPAAGCDAQSSDKAFGERVRAYLLAHPEVLQEAFEKLQAKEDQQKALDARAAIVARRVQLEHDPRDPVLGNPAGKVTVVEFFDYRCPFCKAAEPDIQKLLADNKDVRLVLKEFPILDLEDQTHISENAARVSLAELRQGKYPQVHEALLAQKHLDEAAIAQVLAANGINAAQAQAAGAAQPITDLLAQNHALAHDIGVDGTPGFVVGDQLIAGARMDDLRAAIAAVRAKVR